MDQQMFVIVGGRVCDPETGCFADLGAVDIKGVFGSYDDALVAWREASFQHVDDAFMRYEIRALAPVH